MKYERKSFERKSISFVVIHATVHIRSGTNALRS